MWLPPKHRIPATIDPNLQEGAYNHPVIIMSRIPSPEGLVEIFMVSYTPTRVLNGPKPLCIPCSYIVLTLFHL